MQYFQHTTVIAHPREKVFAFMEDFSQAPRWRSMVSAMETVDGVPLNAGTRVRVTVDIGGERIVREITMLAFEPPVRWLHRTDESDIIGEIEYRLEREGDGTRVTMTGTIHPRGLTGWLAMPLMWLRRGQAYREQLPQLKRVMEHPH